MDEKLVSLASPEPGRQTGKTARVLKFPRFREMGEEYPFLLEQQYERVLKRIDDCWETSALEEVLSELLIDQRGGRVGFSGDVLNEVMRLKEFAESERMRLEELAAYAENQLNQRGYMLREEDFWRVLNAGDQELVDLFVTARFRFKHLRDTRNASPLLAALKLGHTIIAMILAKAGSDPDTKDKLGLTPLLVCCGRPTAGYQALAELLLRRGASLHTRDPMGNSPLHLAVTGGQWSICRLLLEKGARKDTPNKQGVTALSLLEEAYAQSGDDQIKALIDWEPATE